MKLRKLLVWGIFWGSAVVLSTGALVYAFNPQPDPPGHYYGLMTLEAGQKLSLHVANTKMAVDAFRPEQSMCTARLEVVDSCGAIVAGSIGRIQPGASRSLNFTIPTDQLPPGPCADPPGGIRGDPPGGLDDGDIAPPEPGRSLVRAQVVFAGQAAHCISSVEVGDPFVGDPTGLRTGGSGFIHPGLIVGFNPQPDPPGAPTKR